MSRHPFPLPLTSICHHIHTIFFCVTQPVSILSHTPSPPNALPLLPLLTSSKFSKNGNHNADTRHDSPIPISSTHNTYSLILVSQSVQSPHIHPPHSQYIQSHSRVPKRPISSHTPPHSQYIQPLSRVPTRPTPHIFASHSQYIPPYSPRPNLDLLTYTPPSIKIHTASFSCPKASNLLTYTPPTHNTYSLFVMSQRVQSPHIHPSHSQYIQPLCRVPTGVDLPSYTLPFLFSLPTNTVCGRGIRGVVCCLSEMLSLAGEASVKHALCVQCQPTLSGTGKR